MNMTTRNAITESGNPAGRPMLFAHGFGCDQSMWRFVAPAFEGDHRVVLFDHVGSGRSDLASYDRAKYGDLGGYADDMLAIATELDLRDVILVAHSVSSMMGALAAAKAPDVITSVVMVGPSASYINDGDYVGGFTSADIEGLLETMDHNYLGWSAQMAPVIMDNADRPELGEELTNSFCRTDPDIARHFARTTFLGDNRADLAQVAANTLVLQARTDAIAPVSAGTFVHDSLPNSTLVILETVGHCPHLSDPEVTVKAIQDFLATGA